MDIEFIIGITTFIILVMVLLPDHLPKKYQARSCMGTNWKREFPSSDKSEIRDFLIFFTDAFAFSRKDKLKFEPNDIILDIYRGMYPSKLMADSLELETLADDLETKYNLKFDEIWSETLTLGELFSRVKRT
ncbi:MAG: hypothetical protein GY787_09110 [Alteromonadales bacterium]|nr:hypothetical protein [Alteromonadales bacterium]